MEELINLAIRFIVFSNAVFVVLSFFFLINDYFIHKKKYVRNIGAYSLLFAISTSFWLMLLTAFSESYANLQHLYIIMFFSSVALLNSKAYMGK